MPSNLPWALVVIIPNALYPGRVGLHPKALLPCKPVMKSEVLEGSGQIPSSTEKVVFGFALTNRTFISPLPLIVIEPDFSG